MSQMCIVTADFSNRLVRRREGRKRVTPAGVAKLRRYATIAGSTIAVSCLIPRFDGAIRSLEWKEAIWDRYVMGAPRLS